MSGWLRSRRTGRGRPAAALAGGALRRRIRTAATVTLVALALALVSLTAPRLLGCGTMVILSGSMGDAVPVGSAAVGCPRHAARIQVGDVILLRDQASGLPPVLHRVTAVEWRDSSAVVQTKGDANAQPDPRTHVLEGQVLVHRYALPYAGYVIGFASTLTGWLLLVLAPAVWLVAGFSRDVWRSPRPSGGAPA